jgi:hypothetical protein
MDQAGMMPEEEMSLSDEAGSGRRAEVSDTTPEDLGAFKDFVEGLDLDSLLGSDR